MKVLPEQAEYIQTAIRDAVAIDPLISVRRLQEAVEQRTGRSISDKYLAKLVKKSRRQVAIEADRKQLKVRFAQVSERYRVLLKELHKIIWWSPVYISKYGIQRPSTKEKVGATKLAAQMELALFRTELDLGVFEDRRAVLEEMLREGLLPTELHEQLVGVFRQWKFGKPDSNGVRAATCRTLDH
jgi:hypothetical protein